MRSIGKESKSVGGVAWLCVLALVCATRSGLADPIFAPGISQGTVTSGSIEEASGIASSRNSEGVLWVHNDSGDVARIFAINSHGQLLGTYNIMQPGTTNFATATDFEDIAMGPGPQAGLSYIYVGDIGDNGSSRASISVFRIAEPAVYGRQAGSPVTVNLNQGEWESITLTYPLFFWLFYTHDAETLMCDPQTGDLYVVTKSDDVMRIFRAPAASLVGGATVGMTQIGGDFSFRRATGGCISSTGSEIVIRGYSNNPAYGYPAAQLWTRGSGQTVAQALAGTPVSIPIASEGQGEAIDFDGIGSGYFTLSEGGNQPLYYYQRTSAGPTPPITLVAAGADWKYLDNGSDQSAAWRQAGFNDSGWTTGTAQLGYGDGHEQTVVSYGPDANNKYVTTYFRKTFQVDPSLAFDTLTLKLLYDDGAAVYLNGTEIARQNLSSGAGFTTLATGTQQALENTWLVLTVNPSLLVSGTNTLAVEVHQVSRTDSDVSFDVQLSGTAHQQWFSLTVTKNNDSWGTVDVQPNQSQYLGGSVVTLTATPAAGYAFSHWSGDASGSANPTTVTMNSNKNVTANFTELRYSLSLSSNPPAGGTTNAVPPPGGDGKYGYGTVVTLTANAGTDYGFSNWSGDASGSSNPVQITMNSDKSVTANFIVLRYALTLTGSPAGSGSVAANPLPDGDGKYALGAVVTLTATPAAGFVLANWSGDASGSSNPTTVTMNGNKNVTANFADGQVLTLNVVKGEYGTVTVEPNLPLYAPGTVVTLTATPIEGKSFNEWTIWEDPNLYPDAQFATIDGNPVLQLTMNHDYTVEAAFKCGSGLPLFIAMASLVLAGAVLIRRMT